MPRGDQETLQSLAGNGTGLATAVVDTSNLDNAYPTHVVRRKDLVSMRMPHSYRGLIKASASNH